MYMSVWVCTWRVWVCVAFTCNTFYLMYRYCVMCASSECVGGRDGREWVDVMVVSEWVNVMVVSV